MKHKCLSAAFLFFAATIGFTSCSNDEPTPIQSEPEEVEIKLDYTFVESGSMTRSSGEDVYNTFYEKYIKTKKLTPKTYSLTFRPKGKSSNALVVKSTWETNQSLKLLEGEYTVSGYSYPKEKNTGYNYSPSDSVYLTFSEDITITKDLETLTLSAKYDSFLILFDITNTSKINLIGLNNKTLSKDNNCFWVFFKEKSYYSNFTTGYYSIELYRNNDETTQLFLSSIPFEIGKYYYFNDMTNSFDIPAMESGN